MVVPVLHHAPVVDSFAHHFRDLFATAPAYQHFKNYLTGLIVADRKNFSQIARCLVESADYTNIDRFMNSALWSGTALNDQRVRLIYERTLPIDRKHEACLIIDDTLDEHTGTLFEHTARHYDHCDGSYKLAQNPVTSHYQRGWISFPVEFRTYRTYDEVTGWEEHFRRHFPEVAIPRESKQRNKLKKKYEQQLVASDTEFGAKHLAFRTKIKLACELVTDAVHRGLEFAVVLFDAWYLAPELIEVIERHHKAWISLLKSNRKVQTAGLKIYAQDGHRIEFAVPEIKLEELVKLIPPSANKQVTLAEETSYWTCSFTAQLNTLGKVRLVISFDTEECSGSPAVLVTRQLHWEAKRIINTYCCRFQIEVFYKDAKQRLGFSDYQCRREAAIRKHWYLVFCAYSLLKLDMLEAPAYQTWQRKLKTIGVAVRRQAQWVIEELILTSHKILTREANPAELFKLLFGEIAHAA